MADILLDARGLLCPFPVLKARKALAAMKSGQCLEVLATDPGSQADFRAYCEATGYELRISEQNGDEFRYLIKKTETGSAA